MKNKRSSYFHRQDYHHLYNRSIDGSLIFYSATDFLVFSTIVFSYARKYNVTITDFCIMYNHFHIMVQAESRTSLASFFRQITARFVRAYNSRPGKVKIRFDRGGRSAKFESKKIKACHLYIANNPVEKMACLRAADYKWNFLQYRKTECKASEHHFAEDMSEDMQLALSIARTCQRQNRPLRYEYFELYERKLSHQQFQELKEYIIRLYNIIDYNKLEQSFGGFDRFLSLAADSSGSEYEIREDRSKEDYRHYSQLQEVARSLGIEGNDSFIHETGFNLFSLIRELSFRTQASNLELSRFLHIDEKVVETATGRRG